MGDEGGYIVFKKQDIRATDVGDEWLGRGP